MVNENEIAIVTFADGLDASRKCTLTAKYNADESSITMAWDFGDEGLGDDDSGLYLTLASMAMEAFTRMGGED